MQELNIEQVGAVNGGNGQQCGSSVLVGGATGFGIGATLGGAVGSIIPGVGTAVGAVGVGLVGALIGGAVSIATTPACHPGPQER